MQYDEYRFKLTLYHRIWIKYYRWRFSLRIGKWDGLTQEEYDDTNDWDIWYMRDVFQGLDGFLGRR